MPTPSNVLPLPELVPEQEHLTGYVATVLGNIEYREWKRQLERIDDLLDLSRVEETFQRLSLARRNEQEQRAAEKEKRPFHELSTAGAGALPAAVFAGVAMQCGAELDGRQFPGLRLPVIGVDVAAMFLQAGPDRR